MAQQKIKIKIPPGYTPDERLSIAQDIMEYIQTRAIEQNRGYNPSTGREFKFPKYTKAYATKKGVGLGDVDLVLSADMFNDMKILNQTSQSVTIGFEAGTTSNAKAEGNQKGTYGQKQPIPGKARPFLGLPKSALDQILAKYEADEVSEAIEAEDFDGE